VLRLGAAVLTTVVYLTARAPREGELAFRVMLGGKEINIWRFEVLRLWELEAKKVVLGGAPGVLALVPLMAGGQDFETIRRAWRAVRAAVPGERVRQRSRSCWRWRASVTLSGRSRSWSGGRG
jgi:hypothetical protein